MWAESLPSRPRSPAEPSLHRAGPGRALQPGMCCKSSCFRGHSDRGAAVCLWATSRQLRKLRILFLKENCSPKYKATPLRDVPKRFNQRWAGVSFHNRSACSARSRLLLTHARGALEEVFMDGNSRTAETSLFPHTPSTLQQAQCSHF